MSLLPNSSAVLVALACGILSAAQDPPEVEALKKGQPRDVASYISRVFGCNHWAGEEPYDQKRAQDIKQALINLRCAQLSKDETRLKQKYRNRPKVLQAIQGAKNL